MRKLNIPQSQETPLQTESDEFSIRYAYTRAFETKQVNDPGQDYLAAAVNAKSVCFTICDGVSLSYFGELASRFLGEALLEWVVSATYQTTDDLGRIRADLEGYLQCLVEQGSAEVNNHQVPATITGMLREVLEEKKKLGSETTFVCGRVDLPGETYPNGRLLLAWMGDSRIRLWGDKDELTMVLGDTMKTNQRWSTRVGIVGGLPHIYVSKLNAISKPLTGVTVYTDGLEKLDTCTCIPADQELRRLMDSISKAISSDDLTLLDVSWSLQQRSNEWLSRKDKYRKHASLYKRVIIKLQGMMNKH